MRRTFMMSILFLFVMALVFGLSQQAMTGESKMKGYNPRLAKVFGIDRPFWTPNRIGNYITNNGQLVSHIPTGGAGLEWPLGSGNHMHFAGGIWLAGIKDGGVVTAAAEFVVEFQPGKILANGEADNSQDSKYKVYIIKQSDFADRLANPDFVNWPVADGAPVDENGDPLLIGTETTWCVFNDLNPTLHNNVFQTQPMGIEVQQLTWAFDRPDAFGDMLFYKYTFINKSGVDITEMYVSLWNDIDIDDALDLVGADTTLSMGYMYKTQSSAGFGDAAPAIGMDFFQGPIVPSPGDVANVSGRAVPDFRNLGLTSFAKYINGGPPQLSDPENGPEAYNFMKGLDPFGAPIIDETTGLETKFWHAGDPVTGTGWLDTDHDDKRFLMNSGPFTLAAGDTQEIVVSIMIAQGTTGVQSVDLLRQADRIAQLAYDINFALPPTPDNPMVDVTTEENSIFLSWDSAAETYVAADPIDVDSSGNATEYTFQGYNVYQLDSPVITPATTVKKLATFDVIDGIVDIRDDVFVLSIGQTVNLVVQNASDSGIKRHLQINVDAVSGNAPLIQNRKYYFAVTAFGYNELGIPRTLESPMDVKTIRPQSPPLGTDLSEASAVGEVLASSRVAGPSDGSITATVVDRSALTGHTYEVRFRIADAGPDSGSIVYDVVDMNTSEVKASGFKNQSDALGTDDYPVVDGVLVKVDGAPDGFKSFQMVANGAGPLVPSIGAASDFRGFPGSTPRANADQQVGTGQWFFNVGGGANDGTLETFIARSLRGSNFSRVIPFDWEMRFTARGSWAIRWFEDDFLVKVPFELWNIGIGTPDDASDDYRCIPWFLSNGGVGGLQTDPAGLTYQVDPNDSGASGGTNDPYTPWIYWRIPEEHLDATPGEAGYNAYLTQIDTTIVGAVGNISYVGGGGEAFARTILVSFNGGDVSGGVVPADLQLFPEEGSVIRIVTTKPNTVDDVFTFTSVAPVTGSAALSRDQALELVNVYPNPYNGFNIEQLNVIQRFVTFTHLPEAGAKIRIFTLAGELIKTIDHENGTQFSQWDLRNEDNLPVASGMYIAHIDMGTIGIKVLKLGIFTPEERLDIF